MALPRDLSLRRFLTGLFRGDFHQTWIKIENLVRRMIKTMGFDVAYRRPDKSAVPKAFLRTPAPPIEAINERMLAALPRALPRVAAVVPCYNYGRYVRQAVESLLKQTYPNLEIVVVDDGSTDPATREVLAALAGERVRVTRQENQGLPAARNSGARQTSSDYLVFLDADDTLEPIGVTAMVYALEKNREAAFVYSYQHYFGDYDQVLMTQDYNAYDLLWANHPSVCALVRREAWERVGGYKPELRAGYEDWEFWIALAERGMHGICLPAPVFNYRRHGETMVHAATEKHRAICREILALHPAWYQPESASALKRRWHPLVTVVMPADAAPALMGRTLESLAAQTLGDFEALMLGSGDSQAATHLAAERLGGRVEARVFGVMHEVVNWRTVAASFAKGDFLCFLEGGETLRPTELEELVWREIYQVEFGLKGEGAAPARRLAAREVPEGSAGARGNTKLHKDPLVLDLRNRYGRDLSLIRHISHRTNIMPNPVPAAPWQSGKPHLLLIVQDPGAPAARGLLQAVLRALPREHYHWSVVAEKGCDAQAGRELGGMVDEFFCTADFIPAEQPIDRFLDYLLTSRNVALVFGFASPAAARCMSAWRERYPELRLADLVDEAALRAEGMARLADLHPVLDLRVVSSDELRRRLTPEETGGENIVTLDPAAGSQAESLLELRVKRLAASGDAARRLRDFELEIMAPQQ